MTGREEAAKKQLRSVAADLEVLRDRLQGIVARLPASKRETLAEEDLDAPPEVRALIECVLADRLEPAIRLLQGEEKPKPGTAGGARKK